MSLQGGRVSLVSCPYRGVGSLWSHVPTGGVGSLWSHVPTGGRVSLVSCPYKGVGSLWSHVPSEGRVSGPMSLQGGLGLSGFMSLRGGGVGCLWSMSCNQGVYPHPSAVQATSTVSTHPTGMLSCLIYFCPTLKLREGNVFSCVCPPFCPQRGPHVTITHDALDLTVQAPLFLSPASPTPLDIGLVHWTSLYSPPQY